MRGVSSFRRRNLKDQDPQERTDGRRLVSAINYPDVGAAATSTAKLESAAIAPIYCPPSKWVRAPVPSATKLKKGEDGRWPLLRSALFDFPMQRWWGLICLSLTCNETNNIVPFDQDKTWRRAAHPRHFANEKREDGPEDGPAHGSGAFE